MKAIASGVSPAVEERRAKRRLKEARDFARIAQGWMDRAPIADSTPVDAWKAGRAYTRALTAPEVGAAQFDPKF